MSIYPIESNIDECYRKTRKVLVAVSAKMKPLVDHEKWMFFKIDFVRRLKPLHMDFYLYGQERYDDQEEDKLELSCLLDCIHTNIRDKVLLWDVESECPNCLWRKLKEDFQTSSRTDCVSMSSELKRHGSFVPGNALEYFAKKNNLKAELKALGIDYGDKFRVIWVLSGIPNQYSLMRQRLAGATFGEIENKVMAEDAMIRADSGTLGGSKCTVPSTSKQNDSTPPAKKINMRNRKLAEPRSKAFVWILDSGAADH